MMFFRLISIDLSDGICYTDNMGNHRATGGLALFLILEGFCSPPDKNNLSGKEGDAAMISYSELIQTGIFLVALVGLCCTIFKKT